jgi:hypothetical protein
MTERGGMLIEGEPAKRFRVYWCDINDEPYECDGEYDTIAGVLAHRWRLDRRYKICVGRKYLTRAEFGQLAKEEEARMGNTAPVWKCEFCGQSVALKAEGGLAQLPPGFFENCKLRDHLIGSECVAFRDPATARSLIGALPGNELSKKPQR